MNTFIRQLTALAALWALCELLVPLGRQPMVRLTVHLMVMAALLLSLGQLVGSVGQMEWPVFAAEGSASAATGYRQLALTGFANQMEQVCRQTAARAGYDVQAAVYLRNSGQVERVELYLARRSSPPVMEEAAVAQAIAQLLEVSPERICWQPLQGEAVP